MPHGRGAGVRASGEGPGRNPEGLSRVAPRDGRGGEDPRAPTTAVVLDPPCA
ncbi:hypothetical protein F750_1470 [Streptomyces sp. PAMC 26508]|nr:hypothetical protein F750_1470 [Streptomyces sp. PAMC 26508]